MLEGFIILNTNIPLIEARLKKIKRIINYLINRIFQSCQIRITILGFK